MRMKHKSKDVPKACDVEGCKEPAKKSLSRKKVKKATDLSLGEGHRHVHLCKEHYKIFKKATKKDRELDRLAWQ